MNPSCGRVAPGLSSAQVGSRSRPPAHSVLSFMALADHAGPACPAIRDRRPFDPRRCELPLAKEPRRVGLARQLGTL